MAIGSNIEVISAKAVHARFIHDGDKGFALAAPRFGHAFDLVYDERLQKLRRRNPVLVPSK